MEQPPAQVDLRAQPNPPNRDTSDQHAAVREGVPVAPPPDLTFKWYDGEPGDAGFSGLIEPGIPGYSLDPPGTAQ